MKPKKAKNKRKFLLTILAISIVAVLIVPMLYSTIYLGSVWDVYGKVDNVPVAFVNLDKTVTKDGKEYAIGKELENNLKDNNKVSWKFVSYEQAMKGVEGTDYYAVIEMPEDFSKKIADAQDGNFKTPEIIYISNKGRNFVFSQVSSKVAESIKTEVSSSIQKEVSEALVDSLYDVKVSIKDAGDGAAELQNGTEKLLDGSKDLASGAKAAASGSSQLKVGLKLAADSSSKLQAGTEKLLSGSSDLSDGLNSASVGSKQLENGLKTITDVESKVVNGSASLVDGLNAFKVSLGASNDKIPALVKGASDVNSNTEVIAKNAEQLSKGVNVLADGVKKSSDGISQASLLLKGINTADGISQEEQVKLATAIAIINNVNDANTNNNIAGSLKTAADSTEALADGIKQLETATARVAEGTQQLAEGLTETQAKAAEALDQLIAGAKGIQNGSSGILEGLKTVTSKTGELTQGLDKLNSGSTSLKEGLKAVNDGNISLEKGLNTASEKSGELVSGLKKLSDGSDSLKDGLEDANEGAVKLKDGLSDGYEDMSNKLKFNSDNMSQFVSEPVALKDSCINNVEHYGEGLAPYFISLSLWLGAMFMSMIFSIAKSQKAFRSKFMNSFIGKYIAGSVLVALQAIILSVTLISALGVSPASLSGFYVNNILIAVAFFSIMYGVSHVIGILSAPIMFIVLLLQLASSGGTFPIETAPMFYRVVNKIIPMTYSVSTLRMTLSGLNSSVLSHNTLIMLTFILIFMIGGAVLRGLIDIGKNKNQIANESELE